MHPRASASAGVVCPSCHFVIYEEKLPEADKQILAEYVRSEDYQNLAKDWPSYYLLGKLFEQIKKDDPSIANAYLKASWQLEDNPESCRRCLEKSLEYLDRYLIYPGTQNEEWPTLQVLAGELERMLGEFYRARDRESDTRHISRIISPSFFLTSASSCSNSG
jgi:hypothetical protein